MKKILSLCLGLIMAVSLSLFTACDNGEGSSNRARSFTFSYYEGGYGTEWFNAVKADYESIYTDVEVILKPNNSSVQQRQNIDSGVGVFDLYEIEVDMFERSNKLMDLTELYDCYPYGETDKTISQKIDSRWVEFYNENGCYYQLAGTSNLGMNWVYNKTTIDNALGSGNWNVPNTTDEFFALGDELNSKGVKLTAFAGASENVGGEYTRYAIQLWFAQLLGLTGYENYFSGISANGQVDETSPSFITENQLAIEKVYELAQQLYTKTNKYIDVQSEALSFTDLDSAFYGEKIKGDEHKIGFIYIGSWLEQEAEKFEISTDGQEVHVMKMPVASSIVNFLDNKSMTDETLSAVINAIDEGKTSYDGVSENDFNKIKEARNMSAEVESRSFVVTKQVENDATKKEDVLNFLKYLTSDRAQKVVSRATNGVNVLPFGYTPTDSDLGFTSSTYIKEISELRKTNVIIDIGNVNKTFYRYVNPAWCVTGASTSLAVYLFQTATSSQIDSSAVYQKTFAQVNDKYTTKIANYKKAIGK